MQRQRIDDLQWQRLHVLQAALLTLALGSGLTDALFAQDASEAATESPASSIGFASGYGDGGQPSILGLGIPRSAIPGKTWVEGGAVIIAISDDGKQVFGYSEQQPRWAPQKLEELAGVKAIPVVSQDLAAVQHRNVCYAFNTSRGTWHTLKLPVGELAVPTVGNDSVSVHSASQGDYVFKNSWGKWFSAEEIKTGKVAEFLASQSTEQPAIQTPDAAMTIKVFALQFVRAADAARILRQLHGTESSIAVEERTNELIVRCDAEILNEIEALLTRLDEATPPTSTNDPYSASPLPEREPNDDPPLTVPAEQSFSFDVTILDESVSDFRKKFSEHENMASNLAQDIRKRALPDGSVPEIHRQSLRSAVQQAFDTRQKLQRAELAEFARRLQRIQQSIEMRDRVGKQIVDRRVEELLDPNLNWEKAADSTVRMGGAVAAEPTPIIKPETGAQKSLENVQVVFDQTQMGRPQWLSGHGTMTVMGRGEGRINTTVGSSILLRLTRIPGHDEAVVIMRLNILDASAIDSSPHGFVRPLEILTHNAIPLQVYVEDFDQVLSGNDVTKAIYIPRDLSSVTGQSLFDRVDSWKLDPSVDPVKKAAESGTVVAIVRLSTRAESSKTD